MILCTVACANHLPLAMVMAQSAKECHDPLTTVLCLVEEDIHPTAKNFPYFDKIVLARELNIPNFRQFVFKYTRYEATCAIKPFLLLYLLKQYQSENKFIYLDSDIKVYSYFNEAIEVLNEASIVLTPHLIEPHDINHYEEIARLRDGVYNGGFIGINRSGEAEKFLKWWANRAYYYCYIDYEQGLFLDQKWLELVPCYFSNYHILNHPGYNIANWNYKNRKISKTADNVYLVNGLPLRFIHFSGLEKIYLPDKKEPFCVFRDQFLDDIKELGYEKLVQQPWSYDYFFSGEYIKPKIKWMYRKNQDIQNKFPDPFSLSTNNFRKKLKK